MPPNQVVDREVNAPMAFVLDNFNSTKLSNCVLAEGDPETKVHPFIAVGMVRKTALDIVETVTEVRPCPRATLRDHTARLTATLFCEL